jgi:signal transduction histidine kinase
VRLIVADAGAGFDTSAVRADAFGLISMNERASRAGIALTYVTEPGAGTEVVASWSPEPRPAPA